MNTKIKLMYIYRDVPILYSKRSNTQWRMLRGCFPCQMTHHHIAIRPHKG